MSKNLQLDYAVMPSPFGPLYLVANQQGLCFVLQKRSEADFKEALHARVGLCPQNNDARLSHWKSALNAYFSGRKAPLEGAVSFMLGTPFQQKVWRSLREIPYGALRSYHWLAGQVGCPGASRAVGNACGKNPLPIVLPCHRIIRQDGILGGYTGGSDIKAALLSIEGLEVQDGRLRLPKPSLGITYFYENKGGFQTR